MVDRLRRYFERLLEAIVVVIVLALALLIIVAVIFRLLGNSFSFYDEVASVLLAWLTYYGAALAATKRAHIGFEGIVEAVPVRWGLALVLFAEAVVIAFFVVLAWTGWQVLMVLAGDTLVSLPEISVQLTQSVMPIGAVLFIIGQLLSLPEVWRRVRAGEKLHAEPVEPVPVEPTEIVSDEIRRLHDRERGRRP
jgi:TRAP-type C4-dicarboxylate transport system permease small subunit